MSTTWPRVRLGELLTRSTDRVQIQPETLYREITVRMWGKGVCLRGLLSGAEMSGQHRFLARTGHFIVSRIGAEKGAMGLVPPDLSGAVVSNDFPLFTIDEQRLLPPFLEWYSKMRTFWEACTKVSEGTTRIRLQEIGFLALPIPLPPLVEQRRIVARIEALAGQIAEARSLRHRAAEEAQALLTSARRAAIADRRASTVALDDVCATIIDNLHSNPRLAESGIPCVRSPDVGYGTLNLHDAQRTDEEEYRRRTVRGAPQADDIVLVREGGGTGKCALALSGQRFSLGQRVMMLRPNVTRILPRFLLHQLLSPLVQEEQIAPLSKGSASPHLNIGALRRFTFVLPSLEEQRRVVAYLDGLQAQVDALKRLQAQTAAELDALLPSVLDRAFKGEL